MSSESAQQGMSQMDIYIANRNGASVSKWANTPEDWSQIRRKCSYARRRWYFPMLMNVFVPPKTLTHPLGTPTADLGTLEKVPNEIMGKILCYLDVKSFRRFRNINAKAHLITETALHCKEVLAYGNTAIVDLIRSGLSPYITIGEIYEALTSPKCEFCDEYGSILFLLTCTRTCHRCLCTSPRMAVIGTDEILKYYARFTMCGSEENRAHLLEALQKSSILSLKVRNHCFPGRWVKGIRAVLVDDAVTSPELGIHTTDEVREYLYGEWLHYRTAACIHFPSWNSSTSEVEEGLACKGCHEAFENRLIQANGPLGDARINPDAEDRDRCYSHKDFEKHFEICEHAQRIWMNRAPPRGEPWFITYGGMYWGNNERVEYCRRFVDQMPVVSNEAF
ncbi:hypothetical protein FGADI_7780 [Fusarium gaditjirri]|uniref:F-box domain-containing protein n=1 Tax=Fusarium gaditjirri TaxID=282569 RepID=A0A8H4T4B4_9HYPO|nr:hypothetical protein FGADI_7780 [Fusarium gaditjirri]